MNLPIEIFIEILNNLTDRELFYAKLVSRDFYHAIKKIEDKQLNELQKIFENDIEKELRFICQYGKFLLVHHFKYWFEIVDVNTPMAMACLSGSIEIVKFMLKNGAKHTNTGLEYACQCGNIEIIDLMISCNRDRNISTFWNWGLQGACRGNRKQIIDYMISKGATVCFNCEKPIREH